MGFGIRNRIERRRESEDLAEKVYEIQNANFRQVREWYTNGVKRWRLSESVWMEKSEDHMMWYLWKSMPDQAREFFKAVPAMHFYPDRIAKVLDAQPWVCV